MGEKCVHESLGWNRFLTGAGALSLLVGCATSGASEGGAVFDALDSSISEAPDPEHDSGAGPIDTGDGTGDGNPSEDGDVGVDGDVGGDGDGDGSTGDGDGSTGDGDGEVDPPQTCANTVPTTGSSTLLDDMNDGNASVAPGDGRNGTWYVADDESASPLAPSMAGGLTMTKLADDNYVASVSGGPYTVWGASVGFDLRVIGDEVCAYDLSSFTGVRFRARGTGSVTFKIRTKTTDADPDNYDGHGATVALGSSFKSYVLCFSSLTQLYGTITPFEKNAVKNLNWQADPNVAVSFAVDDVELVAGSCTGSVTP